MSGPWTKFGTPEPQADGPWANFAAPAAEPARAAVKPDEPNTFTDVLKSGLGGLASGAAYAATLPESLPALGKTLIDYAAENLLPEGAADTYSRAIGTKSDERVSRARDRLSEETGLPMVPGPTETADKLAAVVPKPETTAGEYAKTIGEFVPAALAGPGGIVRRALAQTVAPAVTSETAGQLTEGTAAEPYARIVGAVGGALAPAALSRAVTPFPISAERQAFVDVLEGEGVPLTAGQRTGSKPLQYAESMLGDVPFGSPRARELAETQGDAFSTAAMRRVGETGSATPDRLAASRNRISQSFEDISSRNSLVPDQQFATDFTATVQEYARVLPANQREVFGNMAGDIVDRFAGGAAMPGRDYQQIRSRLSRMSNSARNNDPEFSNALRGLRNSLDDAFARQVIPEDAAGLTQARTQWGNLKTLEKAASGAGENAAFGRISPAQLRQSVASGNNRGAYARGQGDFAELARAGQAVMTPLPNSGTAQRSFIASLVGGGAGAAGMVDGGMTAAAALAAPALASRAVLSGPGQAYLSNQLLARLESLPPRQRAAVAAALAARQAGGLPAQPAQ